MLLDERRTLQDKFKWDLRKWRSYQEGKGNKEFIEGFEMLSLDNNAGWELLCALMSYKPRDRCASWLSVK